MRCRAQRAEWSRPGNFTEAGGHMHRREFLASAVAAGSLSSILAERTAARGMATVAAAQTQIPNVQVLVFDTFGTVVDWRSSVIAEGQQLRRAKGLKVDWAEFADAWRAGYAP